MLRWHSAQGAYEAPEADTLAEQFEMLRDYILKQYYRPDEIKGWKLSEMKRPDRKTIQRLIRFFLYEW